LENPSEEEKNRGHQHGGSLKGGKEWKRGRDFETGLSFQRKENVIRSAVPLLIIKSGELSNTFSSGTEEKGGNSLGKMARETLKALTKRH